MRFRTSDHEYCVDIYAILLSIKDLEPIFAATVLLELLSPGSETRSTSQC